MQTDTESPRRDVPRASCSSDKEYCRMYQTFRLVREDTESQQQSKPLHGRAGVEGGVAPTTIDSESGVSALDMSSSREVMRQWRVSAGLSIHEVAIAVSCDARALAAHERGEGILKRDDLQRVLLHLWRAVHEKKKQIKTPFLRRCP